MVDVIVFFFVFFFPGLEFPCSYCSDLLAFTFGIPFSTGLNYRLARPAAGSVERRKNLPFGTAFTYFSSGLKQHTKSRNSLGMSRASHWSMRVLILGFDKKVCLYFFPVTLGFYLCGISNNKDD